MTCKFLKIQVLSLNAMARIDFVRLRNQKKWTFWTRKVDEPHLLQKKNQKKKKNIFGPFCSWKWTFLQMWGMHLNLYTHPDYRPDSFVHLTKYIVRKHVSLTRLLFIVSHFLPSLAASLEIDDCWWGPQNEESPLQVDASSEYSLHCTS